ncbi:hypothetical protein PIB30_000404 [Stylosanthes scabra]|uniref:Uncharacterized protein n=1 Tax=Stylosanthes scabra TaxID=79078 RepID=A0ABU6U522_9FABA|nr:hypothetical protein [Stylosanthes scabra]
MEAGTALTVPTHIPIHLSKRTAKSQNTPFFSSPFSPFQTPFRTLNLSSPRFSSSSSSADSYKGPKPKRDFLANWVSQNDDVVRTLPIYVGAASLLTVLLNRALSGIAPVADAGSSQSRADLLTLGAWESLSDVTCCQSLIIVYESSCVLQIGVAAESSPGNGEAVSMDANKLMQGSIYQGVMKSGAQSYLANLSLYPGRSELPFLPPNTQAVILQPLGEKGIAIIGGDTIRGFTTSDQAWISFIGEKLDSTLAKYVKHLPVS